ncbi:MAG: S-layer homology domain-containing protein [Oscillospiraceae bacterium]|nr:S-layer homology domain-containing protein [Oscillospiraceae bacterium]
MKNTPRRILSLLLAAALLFTPALAAGDGTGGAAYENTVTLTDGFTYTNAISFNASGSRVETFALDWTPGSSVSPVVLACDTIYGSLTISDAVSYAENTLGLNVVGAVNSDFFYSSGVPCGMVVENGIYKSSNDLENAVAFTSEGAFISQTPVVTITLTNAGQDGEREGASVSLTDYNKVRSASDMVLYSEYFSTVSTRTTAEGWMVRFRILEGEMTVSSEMTLEVEDVNYSATSDTIGEGYLILTAQTAAGLDWAADCFAAGDIVTLTTTCTDERLAEAESVCGCGDLLLSDGELTESSGWNSSIASANPRTALGIRADGSTVLYVVDGRSSLSSGASLTQLAEDLKSMGCEYAVNLDGGGSSALSLRLPGSSANTVINVPSDGSERKCACYILFVTDEAAGGAAENLFLEQDGAIVFAGSSLDITALATDAALSPASVPSGLTVTAERGTVSGGVYTAPDTAGDDTLTLSAGGVTGTATLHIITEADSLTLTHDGSGGYGYDIALDKGAELTFSYSASCLSRSFVMDGSGVSYTVSGGIGEMSEDGVFTASGEYGAEGAVTVEIAGVTTEYTVYIIKSFGDITEHWARRYVEALYQSGIVTGTEEDVFSPDSGIIRGDFALMLYRAAGEPEVEALSAFTDVPEDAYYAKAIAWAQSMGIASGYDEYTFGPQDALTREQAFTLLWRALGALGVEAEAGDTAALDGFADGADVSEYAREAVAGLITLGAVSGDGETLSPQSGLTRAEMAKILAISIGV